MNIDTLCPSVRVTMKKAAKEAAHLEALVPSMNCSDAVHHAITEVRAKQSAIIAGLMMVLPVETIDSSVKWIEQERDRILDTQQLRFLNFGY